jgi:poly-gamma-glutamate synthesis protein (capsule biosynthesis protein)
MRYIIAAAIAVLLVVAATLFAVSPHSQTAARQPVGEEASILFTGDLMLGRYVGASLQKPGYDAAFTDVKNVISGADLAVGNLEGPLVPADRFSIPAPFANQLLLTGDARAANALASAGFGALSLANNHSLDAGQPGIEATQGALKQAGIDALGGKGAVVREAKGIKIVLLAYTLIPANQPSGTAFPAYIDPSRPADIERMSGEIAQARKQAEIVAVVMHWGDEYAAVPNEQQKKLAHEAAEAGADLIVGAHPHVVQGMELIQTGGRSTLVAYSLGNALFDQVSRPDTQQGFALRCVVDHNEVKQANIVPLQIDSSRGYFAIKRADSSQAREMVNRAAQSTGDDLKWQSLYDASGTPAPVLAYRRPQSPTSYEDLGMDGLSLVKLENGTLSVSGTVGGKSLEWQTEPGWRVTGYTVGDANGDGKPEIIYTVWKHRLVWNRPDSGGMSVNQEGGDILPHIYINGWRDGEMRPVWHGSPRPAPVLAAAVAPIGPRGKPLLASLDSGDPQVEKAPGTINVWEWTGGFGYELVTTLPGKYSELWSDGKALLFR